MIFTIKPHLSESKYIRIKFYPNQNLPEAIFRKHPAGIKGNTAFENSDRITQSQHGCSITVA